MAHSMFHILPERTRGFSRHQESSLLEGSKSLQLILIMIWTCVVFLGLFAPEKPHQLASICEKHNSINACQVW